MEYLFDICCRIMSSLGDFFGLSYKEICVIGNIYIQGGIWVLSALSPFIALLWMIRKNTSLNKKLCLFLSIGYGLISSYIFVLLCKRYSFPTITTGFDICVEDLVSLAKAYNTTYQAINIYIFVIAWILCISLNLLITKFILGNKMVWSSGMIIALTLSILALG